MSNTAPAEIRANELTRILQAALSDLGASIVSAALINANRELGNRAIDKGDAKTLRECNLLHPILERMQEEIDDADLY